MIFEEHERKMKPKSGFAAWKQRSKLFSDYYNRAGSFRFSLEQCCQAAYRAGERAGLRDCDCCMEKRGLRITKLMNDILESENENV